MQPKRTAIVTGAGKRVGVEVARALLADGWAVSLMSGVTTIRSLTAR